MESESAYQPELASALQQVLASVSVSVSELDLV
jgi:hypothetical protein